MIAAEALELETARYEEFQSLWAQHSFGEQRLGQAFYNHFKLHKLKGQDYLHELYEADGDKALALIHSRFLIR